MKSLAITSGKGGVGKTNVAANLGLCLGAEGKRVLLFDADLGLSNLDVMLGVNPTGTIADVLAGERTLPEILVPLSNQVDLVPAGAGIRRLERPSSSQRLELAAAIDGLAPNYDLLIIDTGAGIGDNVLFFNDYATAVLVVTMPEPAALTDAYAMVKVLAHTCHRRDVAILVNQAVSASVASAVQSKLEEVSQRFLNVQTFYAGYLPSDPALLRAVASRSPVMHTEPQAPFCRGIRALCGKLDALFQHAGQSPRQRVFQAWPEGELDRRKEKDSRQ